MSHILAGNQYPSLTKVPPNIAQSFAPVFVQPQNMQSDSDIYSDYVKNPYNLTLQAEAGEEEEKKPELPEGNRLLGSSEAMATSRESNIFQSANYFGNDTGVIPPGSEVFFGGP